MAKTVTTGRMVRVQIDINGRSVVDEDGRIGLTVEVDGRRTVHRFSTGSHHEALYMAAVTALRHADRACATHVEIKSPNEIIANHMDDDWKRRAKNLSPFQNDLEGLIGRFDDVKFR